MSFRRVSVTQLWEIHTIMLSEKVERYNNIAEADYSTDYKWRAGLGWWKDWFTEYFKSIVLLFSYVSVVLSPWLFCPHWTLGHFWRHFWLSQLREGCFWHPVGRGQDAAEHPAVRRTTHLQQRLARPQMQVVLRLRDSVYLYRIEAVCSLEKC